MNKESSLTPKIESSAYDPKQVEDKIYKMWENSGYFNPDNLPAQAGKNFCITVPPPNVTGSLHMGHALNVTIQDIIIRKKRMEGYKTLWLPGTDHAGIATQNVVEKDLKKQGMSRHDLGREKFLEKVWEWKEKYGDIILNQFKRLGASMDWSRTRFTMDEGYQKSVKEAFLRYHKKGWLYKAERVINWCTRCQTSLSDLELEYKEEQGKLWFIRYPLLSDPKNPNTSELPEKIVEKDLSYKLVGVFFDVQKKHGRFCRERQYADALKEELEKAGIKFTTEMPLEIAGRKSNFADFIIENKIIIELKAKPFIDKEDYYQISRYLETADIELGMIVNFRQKYLKPKRILNPKFGTFGFHSDVSNRYVVVATTRPETMLGDSAVAVNPKDKRYENLIGKKLMLPIMNREIPIIADEEIDMAFGTGAVKVTPAHDLVDARIGEKNNLPIHKVIGQLGKMTEEAGPLCAGLKISECREKVLEELKKLNLIEKEENYTHNVALCYRCNGVMEPLPSPQWFLKMDELAKMAIKTVKNGEVKFYPENWEKIYMNWLENVRDWNISRQIWWGHTIPVWYCANQTGITNDQLPIPKKIGNWKLEIGNFVTAVEKPRECPFCKKCEMKQDTDVLDTWFSSALWPFATLGWPDKTKDLEDFYPTQVLSTARDIINLWVARMIYSGLELVGKKPFSNVIIHGTILAKDGRRMSKSLGTGVDPMNYIEKYGADATRFGLIWQAMGGQDIKWDENAIIAGKKFANKLWNINRFVLQKYDPKNPNTSELSETMRDPKNPNTSECSENSGVPICKAFGYSGHLGRLTKENKEIITRLSETKKSIEKDIDNYEFGQALHTLYDFIWHDFADKYIESSKKSSEAETAQTLNYCLFGIIKMLHPFMPHITEEIYQNIPGKEKDFLMVEDW